MLTLTIPPKRDPVARGILLVMAAGVIWLAFANVTAPQPAEASQGIIILDSTPQPTPALPTAQPELVLVALPTPVPWIDQALGNVDQAANNWADDQAGQLAQEQDAAQAAVGQAAAEQAARNQYLANIGAQAAHSPRGDVQSPPAYESGPVAQPVDDGMVIVIDPRPAQEPPTMAAAVPPQEYMTERESGGCPAGQIFYPRTGCHAPGSGGPMPGAVGEP